MCSHKEVLVLNLQERQESGRLSHNFTGSQAMTFINFRTVTVYHMYRNCVESHLNARAARDQLEFVYL